MGGFTKGVSVDVLHLKINDFQVNPSYGQSNLTVNLCPMFFKYNLSLSLSLFNFLLCLPFNFIPLPSIFYCLCLCPFFCVRLPMWVIISFQNLFHIFRRLLFLCICSSLHILFSPSLYTHPRTLTHTPLLTYLHVLKSIKLRLKRLSDFDSWSAHLGKENQN